MLTTEYRLYHCPEGYSGDGAWGDLYGTYPALPEATTAAGHPALQHWHTAVDMPDLLFLDWILYLDQTRQYEDTEYLVPRWVIEASGVADEFTHRLTITVTKEEQ